MKGESVGFRVGIVGDSVGTAEGDWVGDVVGA